MEKDYSSIKIISSCFVKPKTLNPKESKEPYYLSPIELVCPLTHYIQHGHFFLKPSNLDIETLLDDLKDSVAAALVHFYPLAGRLCTKPKSVFVDCNNSPGAGFIYAKLDLRVNDIVDSKYVPHVVYLLFDHHKTSNLEGHNLSLLSVKVTELIDGVFIGLSINHMLADGTSFWHFHNSLSQIFQATLHNKNSKNNNKHFCLANSPVLTRWFPEGYSPDSNIPYSYTNQCQKVIESQVFKERIFHFSSETISSLKSKINQECETKTISSFQSLSAMIWKCITRSQRLPYGKKTSCSIVANNRGRIKPIPLGVNYFGNTISSLVTTTKVGELLENELGWAALKIHQIVNEHTSEKVDEIYKDMSKPIRTLQPSNDHMVIAIGGSPRFNMYEIEFGMGKAVAVRSGFSNKFDGRIRGYPGREGGGSVDLAVCLNPKCMEALETDQEFMSFVSS